MRTRKCTICSTEFETEIGAGRPPAFCSPTCKQRSRQTPTRLCIICDNSFIGPNNKYGPFYCSDQCQKTKSICEGCARPTATRFCSHTCLQRMYPPPYTCKTCNNQFPPSRYWLNKSSSFNGPPKYCSEACFRSKGTTTVTDFRKSTDYEIAMCAVTPTHPYSIPLTQSGLPWIDVQPKWPQSQLHVRSQNTIQFWDHALNNLTESLTPSEYNQFLFEFVCRRSSPHPKAVELQDCWSIWPYISQYTDHRYMPRLFQRYCQNYMYAMRAHLRQAGCLTNLDLRMKVMQCASAHTAELDHLTPKSKSHKSFVAKWLKPLPHMPAPWPDPANPRHRGFYSMIQLELKRHDQAMLALHATDETPTYLENTPEEWAVLQATNTAIMDFYMQAVFTNAAMERPRKTAAWPWGPNCYGDLIAAHQPDPYVDIRWEMLTTPTFNLIS